MELGKVNGLIFSALAHLLTWSALPWRVEYWSRTLLDTALTKCALLERIDTFHNMNWVYIAPIPSCQTAILLHPLGSLASDLHIASQSLSISFGHAFSYHTLWGFRPGDAGHWNLCTKPRQLPQTSSSHDSRASALRDHM